MDRLLRVCVAIVLACISTSALAETCIASHYGYSGGRTASGERMNPSAMTAAHRSKPFGSQVTVTSQRSGRSVTVRINDRGPFIKGRCIDLSTGAAHALGMAGSEKVRSTEHRRFGCRLTKPQALRGLVRGLHRLWTARVHRTLAD
jgi:peptidoglycan lytic transglycosylase